jgi:tetratricopeptide (TPR) repeat protein
LAGGGYGRGVDESTSRLPEAQRVASLRVRAAAASGVHDAAVIDAELLNALIALSIAVAARGHPLDGLELADEAVDLAELLMERFPGGRRNSYAIAMANLGQRLAQVGRCGDAVAVVEEAVEISRHLDLDEPFMRAANLGRRLSNLAWRFAEVNELERAAAASVEGLDICRAARADKKNVHDDLYAALLQRQSLILSRLGRRVEALDVARRCLNVNVASVSPGAGARAQEVYGNLGGRIAELSRDPDGRESMEEREAEDRVLDGHALNLWRARALSDHVMLLRRLKQSAAALAASTDAIGEWRTVRRVGPGFDDDDFAYALQRHYFAQEEAGDPAGAVATSREVIALCEMLAERNPRRFGPLLGTMMTFQPLVLLLVDRQDEALATIDRAVEILRPHAAAQPDAYSPRLANALRNYAIWHGQAGNADVAVPAAEECVEVYRRIRSRYPTLFTEQMASVLGVLSTQLRRVGRADEAAAATAEARRLTPATRAGQRTVEVRLPDL